MSKPVYDQKMKRAEVLYAKRIVRDMHPLYNLELELVLPFLDPVIGVFRRQCLGKKAVTEEEKEALANADQLKEGQEKAAADEDTLSEGEFDFFLEEGEDPIGRLGYGIVSYFSLIRTFLFVFAFLSVAYYPVLADFSSWHAYEGEKQVSGNIQYTVGNLGQSMARCLSFKMMTDKVSVGCNTGHIGNFTSFGVYAAGSKADEFNMCYSEAGYDTGSQCDFYSSRESALYTEKLAACQGQKGCIFNGLQSVIPLGASTGPNGEACSLEENATLYIQYSCIVPDDEIELKRFQCLKACCISIFSTLFLFAVINHLEQSIGIEKREWDLQTVTASDYTLEIKIRQEQYDQMKLQVSQRGFRPDLPMGARVKFVLIEELEKQIREISGEDGMYVSDINFAFRNSWLIDALKTRGDAIKWQNWAELNQINASITEQLHERMEETNTPVCAFVTIESETAYNYLSGVPEINLFGAHSKVKEAVEPTNVIWENRDFNKLLRYAKLLAIITAVCIVLGITFMATFKAKDMTNVLIGKYDTSIKCSELHQMYSDQQIQTLAADEWFDYYKNGGEDAGRNIAAQLNCFCTAQFEELGPDAAGLKFPTTDGKLVTTCSEIFGDKATVALIASGVSGIIVAVNFILKVMLIAMIAGLRLKTMTAETDLTMIAIFVGQFVNTAILLVLNNANFNDFDEGVGPLSTVFMVGTECDFGVNWYRKVGAIIIATLIAQAMWPLIELTIFGAMLKGTQWMDRDFGSDSYQTKMPTAQAYVDLYAGPVYLIHYRYSMILLHIGCAFLYGTAMPVLFVVAFFAFLILYINERVLVCYYYREPPSFDEQITMKAISLIRWLPTMCLPFIFWQMGNRQIFETETYILDRASDVKLSGHTIETAMTHTNPLQMTYNSGPFFLFVSIVTFYILKWFKEMVLDDEEEEDQLCEGLADYYSALEENDKAVLIGTEKYFLENYGIRTFQEAQFERLQKSEGADLEKIIMGVATYRPMDNLRYQQELQFEPPRLEEDGSIKRDGVIFISTVEQEEPVDESVGTDKNQADIALIALNMSYVPHDKRATLNFDTKNGNAVFTR